MQRRTRGRWSIVALPMLLMGACGGGEEGDVSGAPTEADALEAAVSDAADSSADVPEGASGPVDVCALLSPDDGAEVAKSSGLGGDVNATATFSVDSAPEPVDPQMVVPLLGVCRFEFYYSEAGSAERVYSGTVVIEAQSADDFGLYSGGTSLHGLGDEAYSQYGASVVRKGAVMLLSGENSMTESFVQAMFAKMVPHLP